MPEMTTAEGSPDMGRKRERPVEPRSESADPETYEQAHVHNVYDAIAPHFSATRFKAWPRIRDFLETLPQFALVADVGCGNGKYFASAQRFVTSPERTAADGTLSEEKDTAPETVPGRRYLLGLDINLPLLKLTQRTVADPNFDPGTAALTTSEQCTGATPLSASTVLAGHHSQQTHPGRVGKRRNTRAASEQERERQEAEMPRTDVVQCDARRCPLRPGAFDAAISIAVIHHYATHERREEAVRALLRLVKADGGRVLIYVWAFEGNAERPKFQQALNKETGDMLVRWEMNAKFDQDKRTFQRYYHLFRKGELDELCASAAAALGIAVTVRESYFDKENWCIHLERRLH